jgi:hypothetical protein
MNMFMLNHIIINVRIVFKYESIFAFDLFDHVVLCCVVLCCVEKMMSMRISNFVKQKYEFVL